MAESGGGGERWGEGSLCWGLACCRLIPSLLAQKRCASFSIKKQPWLALQLRKLSFDHFFFFFFQNRSSYIPRALFVVFVLKIYQAQTWACWVFLHFYSSFQHSVTGSMGIKRQSCQKLSNLWIIAMVVWS